MVYMLALYAGGHGSTLGEEISCVKRQSKVYCKFAYAIGVENGVLKR